MWKYIVRLGGGEDADPARVGAKAASLASSAAAGVSTPPGFAVTTEAFDTVLARGGLRARIDRAVGEIDPDDVAEADRVSAAVRRAVRAQPVPAAVDVELRAAYRELSAGAGSGCPVAVRSSATAEDLPEAGFAGQLDSFPWVVGEDSVLDAVRRCWAGLFTARAIVYRARKGIPAEGLSMAVAVQRMVRSRVAGVAVTLDPGNGDRSKIVIDASWGIGAMVASGEVTPDNHAVDKVMLTSVRTVVSDKREELVAVGPVTDGGPVTGEGPVTDGGLLRRPVDEERRRRSCLTPEEVVAVARLAKAAERHHGAPQEIEWAIEESTAEAAGPAEVVLLQSRPETVWSPRPRRSAARVGTAAGAADSGGADTGEDAGAVVPTLLDRTAHFTASPVERPRAGPRCPESPSGGEPSVPRRRTRFPSPYELPAPPAARGWRRLYPYYVLFREDRREDEERRFWFRDSQHWPRVVKPFETIGVEFALRCLGQFNNRHFLMPAAGGIEYRVHQGYVYLSPVTVTAEEARARVPEFLRRAGHYYAHWDALLENWKRKVLRTIAAIEELDFASLPETVPYPDVESGLGLDASVRLFRDYDRLIRLCYRAWQYHMEFLNLGYAAYLDFFEFCGRQFPGLPDQGIAAMVQGVDMELFRPDDELKSLARLALELGLADELRGGAPERRLAAVAAAPRGGEWLAAWETARRPWFNFTSGNGLYGSDPYWLDQPSIPLGHIADYLDRLEHGERIDRRVPELRAERDRVTGEYRELLAPDAVVPFDAKLALARTVYPYVEDHNFYIEHWTMGVFWRKLRELSRMLQRAGFWDGPDDLLYLGRDEVRQVLFDYANGWAVGTPPAGTTYWPEEIARRRTIVDALASARPEPALNEPPRAVTEPFAVMLWGITPERITGWLGGPADTDGLTGMAASPGVAEGIARVITDPGLLGTVRRGEILVAPVAAPGWGPVLGKIGGAVTDIGGMMSHAAVVCREYSLPAVTGTGTASTLIRTGQHVRLDGSRGTVTILD